MTTEVEKRVFISFEVEPQDKEDLKDYVKDKRSTLSDFIRKAVWFFVDRETTPDKFLTDSLEKGLESIPVNIDLKKLDKFLVKLEENEGEHKKAVSRISKELQNMRLEISTDIFQEIAKMKDDIEDMKRGDAE